MDRESFINELRIALSGKVPVTVIEDNVSYYEEYIISQVRMGKTEEQVLAQLGSPRLLAKTIIEANKHAEGAESYAESGEETYTADDSGETYHVHPFWNWYMGLPGWVHTIVMILIAVLILVVVATVISALFPFIMVALLIWIVVRSIQDWKA